MTNIDKLVEGYVQARDAKDAMKQRHKEEMQPLEEWLDKCEMALLQQLEANGMDSAKTPHGTAYKSRWTKAKVMDWDKVLDYAVEHERFDLFERRVNKTAVQEIGQVPGVDIEQGVQVNVRRA